MSMIWDSSGGENPFWTVNELTAGGSDEQTHWDQLVEPLPFFVGSTNIESERPGGAGTICTVTSTIPLNVVKQGDVILVSLALGETANVLPTLPDNTWTLLAASNIAGSPQQISFTDGNGTTNTSWLAAHVYGGSANDSGSYNFIHFENLAREFGAQMVVYRGAGTNFGNYSTSGFTQNTNSSTFSIGATTPPGQTQLLDIVLPGAGCENGETGEPGDTYSAPTGTPPLVAETPLHPQYFPWLASDVSVPTAGQSYGPYSFSETVNGGCPIKKGGWLAWEVAIPTT
jgi:hypothetical protein